MAGEETFEEDPEATNLARYLGHLDMVCGFYEDGLIKDFHMHEQYDPGLPGLYENKHVRKYLKDRPEPYKPLRRQMRRVLEATSSEPLEPF